MNNSEATEIHSDNAPRPDLAFAICCLLDTGIIRPDASASCWCFGEHRFAGLVAMIEQLEDGGELFWNLFDEYRAIENPAQR